MPLHLRKGKIRLQNTSLPPRREKSSGSKWPWILMVACFVVAAIGGALFASSGLLDKPKPSSPSKPAQEELLTAHDKATIMIMGVDEREDDVGRSDTLMIATLDPVKNKAALLSIPRDTRVGIQGYGYDKINAAYAYGGEELTQDTVESFLGLDIDHYIIINTHSFVKIIDAIGGIDVYVDKRMYYEDPWDDDGGLIIDLYPGLQHMDGKTAVTYVRYRDEEGDIGRIKRQQTFMRACVDQITSPSIIPKLPSVIREVADSIKTDLSIRQLLEFAGTLKEAQKNSMTTEMVPGRPMYIDGISYWIPEIESLRMTVADNLDVTINSSMRSNFERAAREYEDSIPSTATEVPDSDTSIGRAVPSSSNIHRTERQSREADEAENPRRDPEKEPTDREPRRQTMDAAPTESERERQTDPNTRPTHPFERENANSNIPSDNTRESEDNTNTPATSPKPEGIPSYSREEAQPNPGDGLGKTI